MFRCGGRKRSGCKRLWQRRARDEWRGEQPFKTDKCCVVSDFGSRWLLIRASRQRAANPTKEKRLMRLRRWIASSHSVAPNVSLATCLSRAGLERVPRPSPTHGRTPARHSRQNTRAFPREPSTRTRGGVLLSLSGAIVFRNSVWSASRLTTPFFSNHSTSGSTQATTAMATGIVVPPARAVPHRVGERIRVKGFELTEHFFTVPLDHFAAIVSDETAPASPETLEVFVREVVAASKVSDPAFDRASMPALLFLQGGPGFEAARPIEAGGWLAEATKSFRVFLLDQRGTGRSTRVTNESLQRKFGDIANDQLATTRASKYVSMHLSLIHI